LRIQIDAVIHQALAAQIMIDANDVRWAWIIADGLQAIAQAEIGDPAPQWVVYIDASE
jgi:hypothetical protein